MGKYALNHGSGKLHKETCFLVKEAFHSKKAFRIDEVLEAYPKKKSEERRVGKKLANY